MYMKMKLCFSIFLILMLSQIALSIAVDKPIELKDATAKSDHTKLDTIPAENIQKELSAQNLTNAMTTSNNISTPLTEEELSKPDLTALLTNFVVKESTAAMAKFDNFLAHMNSSDDNRRWNDFWQQLSNVTLNETNKDLAERLTKLLLQESIAAKANLDDFIAHTNSSEDNRRWNDFLQQLSNVTLNESDKELAVGLTNLIIKESKAATEKIDDFFTHTNSSESNTKINDFSQQLSNVTFAGSDKYLPERLAASVIPESTADTAKLNEFSAQTNSSENNRKSNDFLHLLPNLTFTESDKNMTDRLTKLFIQESTAATTKLDNFPTHTNLTEINRRWNDFMQLLPNLTLTESDKELGARLTSLFIQESQVAPDELAEFVTYAKSSTDNKTLGDTEIEKDLAKFFTNPAIQEATAATAKLIDFLLHTNSSDNDERLKDFWQPLSNLSLAERSNDLAKLLIQESTNSTFKFDEFLDRITSTENNKKINDFLQLLANVTVTENDKKLGAQLANLIIHETKATMTKLDTFSAQTNSSENNRKSNNFLHLLPNLQFTESDKNMTDRLTKLFIQESTPATTKLDNFLTHTNLTEINRRWNDFMQLLPNFTLTESDKELGARLTSLFIQESQVAPDELAEFVTYAKSSTDNKTLGDTEIEKDLAKFFTNPAIQEATAATAKLIDILLHTNSSDNDERLKDFWQPLSNLSLAERSNDLAKLLIQESTNSTFKFDEFLDRITSTENNKKINDFLQLLANVTVTENDKKLGAQLANFIIHETKATMTKLDTFSAQTNSSENSKRLEDFLQQLSNETLTESNKDLANRLAKLFIQESKSSSFKLEDLLGHISENNIKFRDVSQQLSVMKLAEMSKNLDELLTSLVETQFPSVNVTESKKKLQDLMSRVSIFMATEMTKNFEKETNHFIFQELPGFVAKFDGLLNQINTAETKKEWQDFLNRVSSLMLAETVNKLEKNLNNFVEEKFPHTKAKFDAMLEQINSAEIKKEWRDFLNGLSHIDFTQVSQKLKGGMNNFVEQELPSVKVKFDDISNQINLAGIEKKLQDLLDEVSNIKLAEASKKFKDGLNNFVQRELPGIKIKLDDISNQINATENKKKLHDLVDEVANIKFAEVALKMQQEFNTFVERELPGVKLKVDAISKQINSTETKRKWHDIMEELLDEVSNINYTEVTKNMKEGWNNFVDQEFPGLKAKLNDISHRVNSTKTKKLILDLIDEVSNIKLAEVSKKIQEGLNNFIEEEFPGVKAKINAFWNDVNFREIENSLQDLLEESSKIKLADAVINLSERLKNLFDHEVTVNEFMEK